MAPLAVLFAFIVLDAFGGSFQPENFSAILLLYGVFPFLIATLFFIPLMFILRRAGHFGGVFFVLAGSAGGLVVASISSIVSQVNTGLYLWLMLAGALSSFVFYRIAITNR